MAICKQRSQPKGAMPLVGECANRWLAHAMCLDPLQDFIEIQGVEHGTGRIIFHVICTRNLAGTLTEP